MGADQIKLKEPIDDIKSKRRRKQKRTFNNTSGNLTERSEISQTEVKEEVENKPKPKLRAGRKNRKIMEDEEEEIANQKVEIDLNGILNNPEKYEDVIDEFIETHNKLRATHKSPGLIENRKITKLAQKEAERLASIDKTEETKITYNDCFLGVNSYFGKDISVEKVIRQWYNSGYNNYNYSNELKSKEGYQAFTQLLWKSSKEVGFGFAKSKTGYYAVALYYPPGNEKGLYKMNVFDDDEY